MASTGQAKNSYGPQMGLFSGGDVQEQFVRFHNENPLVFALFEKFALRLLATGRTKIGSKMIIERIRWEVTTNSKDDDGFKINNNFTAYYSRMFMKKYPQHNECFFTKKMKSE